MASTRPKRLKTKLTTGLRVIIYIRVSALMGRAGDTFHSPDVQERVIRAILPPDAVVVAVIQDIDVSGQTFVREGLDQVRGYAERREADVVAVADLSRLGRRVLGSLEFIAWLNDRGVSTWSAKEHIDDSPTGRFMLMVILGLAQMIGEQIGQQWASAIASRALKGQPHGSRAPAGYVKVKGGPLAVDPLMAPAVQAAFRAYADGTPLSRIAEAMSDARGKGTALPVVKWILSNPVYLGQVMLHGEIVKDADGQPVGLHEALIDQDTWDRVQARRERDSRAPSRSLAEPSHPFMNLARCAACKKLLGKRDEIRKRDGARIPRLMCLRIYKHYGPDRCVGAGTPSVAELEAVVLAAVRVNLEELRTRPEAHVEVARRRAVADDERGALERDLAKARGAQARLLVQLAEEENASPEVFAQARAELREREQRLIRRLAELTPSEQPRDPRLLEEAMASLLVLWPDATASQRGRMLHAAGVKAVWVRRPEFVRESVQERSWVEFV